MSEFDLKFRWIRETDSFVAVTRHGTYLALAIGRRSKPGDHPTKNTVVYALYHAENGEDPVRLGEGREAEFTALAADDWIGRDRAEAVG